MGTADPPTPTAAHAREHTAAASELTVLEGVLERVLYANESSGWCVVRVEVPGKASAVTAVGGLAGVQPGENLRLSGRWVVDKRYGEQFRVETYLAMVPATLVGIERYLGSGVVPGLGHAMATRIVERFGLKTLDVIENEPKRLTEVEGIGRVRSRRIQRAWKEQKRVKEVMIFLQAHGVSTAYALRIFRRYGERAAAVVRENPYRLALEVHGIGFKIADSIAAELGVERNSLQRAEAGVLHVLSELAGDGHVFCPRLELIQRSSATLEVDEPLVEQAIGTLRDRGLVVVEKAVDDDVVYAKALHVAESGAATLLEALLRTAPAPVEIDVEAAIDAFEREREIELAAQQRDALRRVLRSKVLVITGGPGTGKTTIVRGVIHVLGETGQRIALCAPTGRAAKRLEEATGEQARTIHRLLGYSPRTKTFTIDPDNPLEADALIVDEVSMIDVPLFHELLRAVPPQCRIILVGDADQLPSVGPGAVLQSLITCGVVEVARLSEIFRQAQESLIVVNAHRVNQGEMPALGGDEPEGQEPRGEVRDFYFIERGEPEAAIGTIKELVTSRIPRRFGVDPFDDIQVLVPMRRGTLGTYNLNRELQGWLNPHGEAVIRGERELRRGDKVMQVRNNYDLDVYNGDIGRIEAIEPEERIVRVRFDERVVDYDQDALEDLVLAYACSIHKSQGSEYPVVVIVLTTQHYAMLQRNLLYTALTRGKKLVVLVGSRKAVGLALRNDRVQRRNCRLAERLNPSFARVD